MAIKWDDEKIARLLACKTDEELCEVFPGLTVAYLKRKQAQYRPSAMELPESSTRKTKVVLVEEVDVIEETRKDRQIARLTDEISHLKKVYTSQTRESAALDALVAAIHEVVPTMKPVRVPKKRIISDEVEEESLVLLLGDLHIGETVDPEQTAGISVFNVDIARRRIQYTVDTAISIAREKMSQYHFRRLVVPILGDVVSGIIHDELRVNDELGIVGQLIVAVEILAEALLKLCQEFEEVHVPCVVGNHGRVTEERYFKGKATNNYDYLVYKMLEMMLADQPNLTWDIPKSFFTVVHVENESFLLLHGDVVKSWMGIPFYGLQRAYLKWRALHADYGFPFKHMIVGHYHNPNMQTIVRYELIINGCIKGGDEYSIGAIAAACDPVQIMFGVHPRKGITHRWYLNSRDIV